LWNYDQMPWQPGDKDEKRNKKRNKKRKDI
jgi:hypothetical protein